MLGVLAAGLFIMRWSRRLLRVGIVAGTRAPGAHFAMSWSILVAYVLLSGGLMFGFASTEGGGSSKFALGFVALQLAAIAAATQLA